MSNILDARNLDVRKEYADTLKEIAKLESQIKKLKTRAMSLENQLIDHDDEPIYYNLDKDGCMYWDNLIGNNKKNNGGRND